MNTIRFKILAVATVLLTLFAITTGFSAYLNKQIVQEIEAIAEYPVPLGAHVSSIDVLTFEFELLLSRGIARAPLDPRQVAALRQHYTQIVSTIRNDIKIVQDSLDAGIVDPQNNLEDRIAMAELKGTFALLEPRLAQFVKVGDETLAAIEAGDLPRAQTLFAGFSVFEDAFGKDIAAVRNSINKLILSSIAETQDIQQKELWLNVILFAVAAVFGLALFVAFANRLHRGLEDLLADGLC